MTEPDPRPAPAPKSIADLLRHPDERASAQRSLFGEILDWMLAPLLLIWPMSIAATYLVAQSIADAPFDRALEASVRVLAQQIHQAPDRINFVLPLSARDFLRADDADHVYYQVWGVRGDFLAGDHELPLPAEADAGSVGTVRYRTEVMHGADVRVAYLYVEFEGKYKDQPGYTPALIQVAETLEKRSQLANEIIKGVILPQFVILPISVILVWAGLSRGIQPLKNLQQKLRERKPDDLSPIDEHEAPEEVAPLVSAFNELLARLGHSIGQQKRFIADAAHQMKTPLAGLRTQAELTLREDNTDEIKRSLRQIATSTERATHLINQLLALARAENQAGRNATLAPVELCSLAREAVTGFFEAAHEKRIDLGFEEPGHNVLIHGNALLLSEMLKNLIDNALRYTPVNGAVTARVSTDMYHQFAMLEVEDTGPGIAESERHLVVERFYRVLGTGQDGSGLGLAIVREIAQQHEAEMAIRANPRAAQHTGGDPKLPGCLISVTFRQLRAPERLDD